MTKILAFAGSNSTNSINHHLVNYVAKELMEHQVRIIKLNNYLLPMYSEDLEKSDGFPGMALALCQDIADADALVISIGEHNGGWSAFFKNTIDWLSRIDRNFMAGKKILLMSTSPGQRGGVGALEQAKKMLPRFGAEILESFTFPSFHNNFSLEEQEITDETLLLGLKEVLSTFAHQIK